MTLHKNLWDTESTYVGILSQLFGKIWNIISDVRYGINSILEEWELGFAYHPEKLLNRYLDNS